MYACVLQIGYAKWWGEKRENFLSGNKAEHTAATTTEEEAVVKCYRGAAKDKKEAKRKDTFEAYFSRLLSRNQLCDFFLSSIGFALILNEKVDSSFQQAFDFFSWKSQACKAF